MIEEHERITIPLNEYFRSQFLSYHLSYFPNGNQTINKTEISQLIYLQPPYVIEDSEQLTNDSYINIGVEPYSSSSILFLRSPFYSQRIMNLFVITRDLKFIEFVISTNKDGQNDIKKVNELQLSFSLHNSKCRDLTFIKDQDETIPPSQKFIFFCKGVRDPNENYYSIIMIKRRVEGLTTAIYYNYAEDDERIQVIPDFNKTSQGLKYLKDYDREEEPYKYFSCLGTDRFNGTKYQMIMVLDIRILNIIGENATIEGFPILKPHKYLNIQKIERPIVQDFMLIKNDLDKKKVYFAASVYDTGLLICGINISDFTNQSQKFLYFNDYNCQTLSGQPSNYLTKPDYSFGLDEYGKSNFEANDEDFYFYGIRLQPPIIIEYNMKDINNVQFFKKYQLMQRFNDQMIGTRYIAINMNYLVHLVYDPQSMAQSLRVYNRNAQFKSSAKFEIPIELDYPMNFFAFPNYIFDQMIVRDERDAKLISFNEQAIIIDATGPLIDLARKYQKDNGPIKVQVGTLSPNSNQNPAPYFNVKFLEKENVEILPINETSIDFMHPKIFYNCGSNSFHYIVSTFYNGPNYNLQVQDSNYSRNYFLFQNQRMNLTFSKKFFFKNCRLNFIFTQPISKQAQDFQQGGDINYEQDFEDELTKRNKTNILVCVDFANQMLRSYDLLTLYSQDSENIDYQISRATNQVWMPRFTQFFDFQFNRESRQILGLAQNFFEKEMVKTDDSKFPRYEMHFFEVQNQILWKKRQAMSELTNVTFFNYNSLSNRGLIIDYFENADSIFIKREPGPLEIFYIYKVDKNIDIIFTWYNLNMTLNDRTLKAIQTSEHVIFVMTFDKKIRVYQKWIEWNIGFQLIREFTFIDPQTGKSDLIGFDIFDNKFLVLYRGANIIEIYYIDSYVKLSYKMRLPLYDEYSDYEFYINDSDQRFPDLKHLVRTYLDSSLAILMTHPGTNDTQLLIYQLYITQHNSFILNQSLTDFFLQSHQQTKFSSLIFIGQDRQQNVIGVMNDNKINLYSTQYYNLLVMTPDMNVRKKIIEECKGIKNRKSEFDREVIKEIDSVTVQPVSLFKNAKASADTIQQQVNLTIITQNQGMAVSLKNEQYGIVNISYGNDFSANYSSEKVMILHESYLEGQGLYFNTLCQYTSEQGELINCSKQVVNDQSSDQIYNFSIDFTTGSRRIFKQFTLGKLFFMFDTYYKLNVMRFPIYQQDLKTVSGFALRRINEATQESLFGCNLTGFSDYYNLTEKISAPNETYLFMYHCQKTSESQWRLEVAIITAYNNAFDQDNLDAQQGLNANGTLYSVRKFPYAGIAVPYTIIDLDKINVVNNKYSDLMVFNIAFTCEIAGSETNLLKFYQLNLNMTENGTYSYPSYPFSVSGYNYQKNAFKVTKIEPIKQSQIMLVASEEFGIYIFNISAVFDDQKAEKYLIGEINVFDRINFKEQISEAVQRPFKIISFSINFPSQVICVTNYGIIIFQFPIDLRNTTEILSDYPNSLIPQSRRQIQVQYDEYSKMIVKNPFGNALFVKTLISGDQLYQTQILGMSFFSSQNSLVFKLLSIPAGIGPLDQCSELNPNPYFEITPEDQLAVSYICNQYLYVYRMCMRPHVELDFSKVVRQKESGLAYNPGIFQFNEFQVTIMAQNEKSGEEGLNRQNVTLNIKFGERPVKYVANITDVIILIAVSICLIIIAYLENSLCKEIKEKVKEQKVVLDRYSAMITNRQSQQTQKYQVRALNHTTIETQNNNGFSQDLSEKNLFPVRKDSSMDQLFEDDNQRSPRFNTIKDRLSKKDQVRRLTKQTINNSMLSQSQTSDQ